MNTKMAKTQQEISRFESGQMPPRTSTEELLEMLQKLEAQSQRKYIITTYTATNAGNARES